MLGGGGLVAIAYGLSKMGGAKAPVLGRRVALVGDSLAVGLGPPLQKLALAKAVAFQYQGVVGTTPLQWSENASACGPCGSWLGTFKPDTILVSLGTNDIGYYPQPPAGPYQALVRRWSTIGRVVWIQPPIMPSDRLAGVRSVIASLGVPTIPAQTGLSFGTDGIHPTNYVPWAQSIAAQVFT